MWFMLVWLGFGWFGFEWSVIQRFLFCRVDVLGILFVLKRTTTAFCWGRPTCSDDPFEEMSSLLCQWLRPTEAIALLLVNRRRKLRHGAMSRLTRATIATTVKTCKHRDLGREGLWQ